MKEFTLKDIVPASSWDHMRLYAEPSELVDKPLYFHIHGLSETATGYGKKLTSSRMVHFEGRLRRIYVTCYSNCGTAWFRYMGKQILIS